MKLRWPIWIGVVADDLESQRRFYRDVLGLKELEAGEGWVQFDLDGGMVELLARSDDPQYAHSRQGSATRLGPLSGTRERGRRDVEPEGARGRADRSLLSR